MHIIKKTLAAGAVLAMLGTPLIFASAQTYDATGSTTYDASSTDTTGSSTPGVPNTGVGPGQAATNAILLGVSAVTALVGGYFLTAGRHKVG